MNFLNISCRGCGHPRHQGTCYWGQGTTMGSCGCEFVEQSMTQVPNQSTICFGHHSCCREDEVKELRREVESLRRALTEAEEKP